MSARTNCSHKVEFCIVHGCTDQVSVVNSRIVVRCEQFLFDFYIRDAWERKKENNKKWKLNHNKRKSLTNDFILMTISLISVSIHTNKIKKIFQSYKKRKQKNIWNWMKNKSSFIFSLFCHNFWFHKIVMFGFGLCKFMKHYDDVENGSRCDGNTHTNNTCGMKRTGEKKSQKNLITFLSGGVWLGLRISFIASLNNLRAFSKFEW